MPFLIDGHNLIAALPDISLEDPEDEVALILKLRGWLGHQRRKAIVVFDGGIPGGYSRTLSSSDLEVIFAAHKRSTADRIIMKRLEKLRDAANWTVVSSDREILDFARRLGARAVTSQDFALELQPAARPQLEKPRDPSPTEVREWLEVFPEPVDRPGRPLPELRPVPARPPAPPSSPVTPERKAPPVGKKSPAAAPPAPTLAERLGLPLPSEPAPSLDPRTGKPEVVSPEEVEDWLEVFHDVPEGPPPPRRLPRPEAHPQPPATLTVDKETEAGLAPEEVEAWMALFPEVEPEPPAEGSEENAAPATKPRRRRPEAFRSPKLRKHQQLTPSLPADEEGTDGLSPEEREQWARLYGEEPE